MDKPIEMTFGGGGNWMGPRMNIRHDLSSLDLGIHEARDVVQNWPLWGPICLCTALRTRIGAWYY